MRVLIISSLVCFFFLAPQTVHAARITINDVPSYTWDTGCAPTAAAMILGYWDLHGYDNLFRATGWDTVKNTTNVSQHIDRSQAGSLGKLMGTNDKGQTLVHRIGDSILNFAVNAGYDFSSKHVKNDWSTYWADYLFQINLGNPVLLNVDSNNDGVVDHSVTGIGFEERGENDFWYGFYDTWEEDESKIQWQPFSPIANLGNQSHSGISDANTLFKVSSMFLINPNTKGYGGLEVGLSSIDSVPEPGAFLLFATGIAGITALRSSQRTCRS